MISRQNVQRAVMVQRPDLSQSQVDELIDEAVRLLGNLIHYRSRGNHEDDDVVTAVLSIGRDKQDRV